MYEWKLKNERSDEGLSYTGIPVYTDIPVYTGIAHMLEVVRPAEAITTQ